MIWSPIFSVEVSGFWKATTGAEVGPVTRIFVPPVTVMDDPVGPWAPVAPVKPCAPVSPVKPWAPVSPVKPCAPVSPMNPCAPVKP